MTDFDERVHRYMDRDHKHATMGEAGTCPDCRQREVDFSADAPNCYGLAFYGIDNGTHTPHPAGATANCDCCDHPMAVPALGLPDAVSVVRSWSPILGDAPTVN